VLAPRPAALATLGYLAFPLGIYYSRAAVVDFAAIAFAHAMLYHGLRGLTPGAWRDRIVASACGILGALIKAPVEFPVAVALVWAAWRAGRMAWVRGLIPLVATLVVFMVWRAHVEALNATEPDWSFVPGYFRLAGRWDWYFGGSVSRLDLDAWGQLLQRIVYKITTIPGLVLALLGTVGWRDGPGETGDSAPRSRSWAVVWAIGAVAYLPLFWPLHLQHEYYQLPLLGPLALAVGAGGERLFSRPASRKPRRDRLAGAAFTLFLLWAVAAAHWIGYFRIDWRLIRAGEIAGRYVPAGDLVIAAFPGSRFSDPRLRFAPTAGAGR
jgi:hypothetical protein